MSVASGLHARSEVRATGGLLTILACLAALGTLSTNILLPSLPGMARALDVPIVRDRRTDELVLCDLCTWPAVRRAFGGPLWASPPGRGGIVVRGRQPRLHDGDIAVRPRRRPHHSGDRRVRSVGAVESDCAGLVYGNELARVLSFITVAMAAAPRFSPLLGSALIMLPAGDHHSGSWQPSEPCSALPTAGQSEKRM